MIRTWSTPDSNVPVTIWTISDSLLDDSVVLPQGTPIPQSTVYDYATQLPTSYPKGVVWVDPNGKEYDNVTSVDSDTYTFAIVDSPWVRSSFANNRAMTPPEDWWRGLSRALPASSLGATELKSLFSELSAQRFASALYQDPPSIIRTAPYRAEAVIIGGDSDDYPNALSADQLDHSFDRQSLLDAVELACEVGMDNTQPTCDPIHPPTVDPNNLFTVEQYIRCVGEGVIRKGAMSILQDVPKQALDALRKGSPEGSFPEVGGQIGVQVANLRAQLVGVSTTAGSVATEIGYLADNMATLRLKMAEANSIKETAAKVASLQNQIAQLGAEASCVAAGISAATNLGNSTSPWGAVVNLGVGTARAPISSFRPGFRHAA